MLAFHLGGNKGHHLTDKPRVCFLIGFFNRVGNELDGNLLTSLCASVDLALLHFKSCPKT